MVGNSKAAAAMSLHVFTNKITSLKYKDNLKRHAQFSLLKKKRCVLNAKFFSPYMKISIMSKLFCEVYKISDIKVACSMPKKFQLSYIRHGPIGLCTKFGINKVKRSYFLPPPPLSSLGAVPVPEHFVGEMQKPHLPD